MLNRGRPAMIRLEVVGKEDVWGILTLGSKNRSVLPTWQP